MKKIVWHTTFYVSDIKRTAKSYPRTPDRNLSEIPQINWERYFEVAAKGARKQ